MRSSDGQKGQICRMFGLYRIYYMNGTGTMKVEELINMTDEIDDILYGYGIIVDHDILAHHLFNAIKESYHNVRLEL